MTRKKKTTTPRAVAVGLCRCSTDRQDRSIADQEAAIRKWATEHRVRLLRVFKDEGVSGLKLKRPGLDACLEFLQASTAKGTLVLWSRDRLVRPDDPIDGLLMERQVRYAGWELRYLTGSNSTGNTLVDAILGLVEHHASAEYLRKLARDSLRNVISRLQAGDVPGGKIPYGYAKAIVNARGKVLRTIPRTAKHRKGRDELTRLVPGDPAEIATLRWIFNEYNGGSFSPRALAQALEERRAPRPNKAIPWNAGTVRELLHNPVYVGDIVWNRETSARCVRWLGGQLSQQLALHASRRSGERIAWGRNAPEDHIVLTDRHEPLVARSTFNAAQATMERRARREGTWTPRAHGLVGLLVCGTCHEGMHSVRTKVRGRSYRYYVCTTGQASGSHCCRVRADVLEGAVLVALRRCCGATRRQRRQLAELESVLEDGKRSRQQTLMRSFVEVVTLRATKRARRSVLRKAELITVGSRRIDLLPYFAASRPVPSHTAPAAAKR